MQAYLQTVRSFNPATIRFMLVTALLGFSIDGGLYAVIFNLYLLRLGFGPEAIGQVNFAGLFAFAVFSLPAGALGAHFGTRNLMVAGAVVMAAGSWLLPLAQQLAPNMLAVSLPLSFGVLYLGLAIYFANAAPYLMEITREGERNHAFSVYTALLALSAFVGSMVGGYLPRLYAHLTGIAQEMPGPYRFPLFLAALLMVVAVWVVLGMPQLRGDSDKTDYGNPIKPDFRTWSQITLPIISLIVVLSVIRCLQVAGMGTVATYFNVYLDAGLGVMTARIGVLSALARIMAVPMALVTPYVIGLWGAPRAVVVSSAAATFFILPFVLSPTWQGAGLGYVGVAAFSSLRYPAFIAYCLELVPLRWRGTLSGAGETAAGFSFATMALMGGYIIEIQGYAALFLISAILTLLGTGLFWFYFRTEMRRPIPAHSARVTR